VACQVKKFPAKLDQLFRSLRSRTEMLSLRNLPHVRGKQPLYRLYFILSIAELFPKSFFSGRLATLFILMEESELAMANPLLARNYLSGGAAVTGGRKLSSRPH